VTSFDGHFADRGYGPVLLASSISGVFVTLPDTEEILVMLGVATVVTLLAWPRALGSLGTVGIYLLLGMLAWVIANGGRVRESAVIGATACLGLLMVDPMVRWWRGGTLLDGIPIAPWGVPVVWGLHTVVVLLAARLVGLGSTLSRSVLMASLLILGTAGTLTTSGSRAESQTS